MFLETLKHPDLRPPLHRPSDGPNREAYKMIFGILFQFRLNNTEGDLRNLLDKKEFSPEFAENILEYRETPEAEQNCITMLNRHRLHLDKKSTTIVPPLQGVALNVTVNEVHKNKISIYSTARLADVEQGLGWGYHSSY